MMKPESVTMAPEENRVSHNVDVGLEEHNSVYVRRVNRKQYELVDHLGNVRVVITDVKTTEVVQNDKPQGPYKATLLASNNYYPFGMLQPERHWSTEEYRYGYNGKEMDNEASGNGNQYDYGFRIYNPRIAKFLSVDPLAPDYPWYTPYQFAGNMPIFAIDIDGLEPGMPHCFRWFMGQEYFTPQLKKRDDMMVRGGKITAGVTVGVFILLLAPEALPVLIRFAPAMGRSALIGAGVNGAFSLLKKESTEDFTKAVVSGFLGGAVLGFGGSTYSFTNALRTGFASGAVEEYASQIIENEFQDKNSGYSLNNIVRSAGVTGASSIIAGKLLEEMGKFVDTKVAEEISRIKGPESMDNLRKIVKAEYPSLGKKEITKAINGLMTDLFRLTEAQGQQLKTALTTIIERSGDYIQNAIKDALKEKPETKAK